MVKILLVTSVLCFSVVSGFGQKEVCTTLAGCLDELKINPPRSSVHYRVAEIALQRRDLVQAANEFRTALIGDLQPKWIEVWSHLELGKIFDMTGQRDRALNEYRLAQQTGDDTGGAL